MKVAKQTIILGISLLAAGCGVKKENNEFAGIACGAADQYRSYMNPMDSTLIQNISIDSSFSDAQVTKIEHAIGAWNAYGRKTLGRDLFRAQPLQLAAASIPVPSDNCSFAGVSTSFAVVRVTDASTWTSLGFTSQNPGVTVRCSEGKDFTTKQVVLLNPTNMSSDLFENVVLHELGHAIGLDHSCLADSAGADGYAGCKPLAASHSYKQAVMNPYVSVSDLKEDLRSNDEERASCALNYRP